MEPASPQRNTQPSGLRPQSRTKASTTHWDDLSGSTRATYRAETERGVAGEANGVGRIPPDAPIGHDTREGRTDLASRSLDVPRSVSVHPIHTAGRYFSCPNPEAQWIADMEADAESVEAAQSTEGKVS